MFVALIPPPRNARGGCIGDLRSPSKVKRTPMPRIGYARSDGRVGGLVSSKNFSLRGAFNPHPGSLSLADPPRKGEG
jgi:hypothetical protein